MPVVRLKPLGYDKHCAFLERNGCAVQAFKPTVCAMFPIGRFRECGKDKSDEISYMFTNPNCGDKREIHTVRGWLANRRLKLRFFILIFHVVFLTIIEATTYV